MVEPRALDTSPLSEFVTLMRDVFRRRLSAVEPRDQRALEAEMKQLMCDYLGRDAWEAVKAAEQSLGLPRATRRRVRPGPPLRYAADGFDYKVASLGEREDDE